MHRFFTLMAFFLLSTPFSPVLAKFEPNDAEEVDRQEDISLEFYNDIISYRAPIHVQNKWDESPVGFRLNAGSLDAKEFSYLQESKFFFTLTIPTAFLSNRK